MSTDVRFLTQPAVARGTNLPTVQGVVNHNAAGAGAHISVAAGSGAHLQQHVQSVRQAQGPARPATRPAAYAGRPPGLPAQAAQVELIARPQPQQPAGSSVQLLPRPAAGGAQVSPPTYGTAVQFELPEALLIGQLLDKFVDASQKANDKMGIALGHSALSKMLTTVHALIQESSRQAPQSPPPAPAPVPQAMPTLPQANVAQPMAIPAPTRVVVPSGGGAGGGGGGPRSIGGVTSVVLMENQIGKRNQVPGAPPVQVAYQQPTAPAVINVAAPPASPAVMPPSMQDLWSQTMQTIARVHAYEAASPTSPTVAAAAAAVVEPGAPPSESETAAEVTPQATE
jgi:hypothetical protein